MRITKFAKLIFQIYFCFCSEICREDWIEIYELYPSGRERKLGRYCGRTAPGPVMSEVDALKVILQTDDKGVASGFTATYEFFTADTRYVGKHASSYFTLYLQTHFASLFVLGS